MRQQGNPWDGSGINPKIEGTSIERIMAQILGTLGVEGQLWARQYSVPTLEYPYGNHAFDFAIPRQKILIECDGCFVHGCPTCHPDAGTRPRDALLDMAAKNAGWTVERFWQHELEQDSRGCRVRIERILRPQAKTQVNPDNPLLM